MRLLVASALFLGACNGGGGANKNATPGEFKNTGDKILSVNGTEAIVTEDMVHAITRLTPESELQKRKDSGQYVKMVEQVGLGEYLYREALKAKVHEDKDVQKALKMKAREVLAQELLAKRVEERVTDDAIKAVYDERSVQYKQPQARARHILVKEEALANEIMEKLGKGEKFDALVTEFSADTRTRGKGGDLGWFTRTSLIPEVAEVAFTNDLEKPQGPIETRFGFHIVEPLERRDGVPLEEVKGQLDMELRQKEYGKVLEEVRAAMKIEYYGELKELKDKAPTVPVLPNMPGGPPHGGR